VEDPHLTADYRVTHTRADSHNVLGRLPGKQRPTEAIMYAAHWDAYGLGPADASGDKVRHGAVDDAIGLAGKHQAWNAALAVAALHASGMAMSYESVHYGLKNVSWPGRFEIFQHQGSQVILDGAHNPQGAAALAETWREKFPNQKASIVFSAVAAKDISGILESIAPLGSRLFLCPVDTPRALSAEEIAASLPENAVPHELFPDFNQAFQAANAHSGPILVAGSLFLVGEARAMLVGGEFQSSAQ